MFEKFKIYLIRLGLFFGFLELNLGGDFLFKKN